MGVFPFRNICGFWDDDEEDQYELDDGENGFNVEYDEDEHDDGGDDEENAFGEEEDFGKDMLVCSNVTAVATP